MDNEVKLKITTDASGAVTGIQGVTQSLKNLEKDSGGITDYLQAQWVNVAAKIYAVEKAISAVSKIGTEYAAGAMVMQTKESFDLLAKSSDVDTDAILANMKRLSAGTMDEVTMMQKYVKATTQGIAPEDMGKLAEIARVTARTQGIGIAEAFEAVTDSIANQLPRALKKFGLVTKEEMQLIEAAVKEGVDDIDLLQLSYLNAQIKISQFGGMVDNATESLQRHHAELKDLKDTLEVGFVKAVGGAWAAFKSMMSDTKKTIGIFTFKGQPSHNYLGHPSEYDLPDWTPPGLTEEEARRQKQTLLDKAQAALDAKKMAPVIDQFNEWTNKIENMNPGLDTMQKSMQEIAQAAEKFREKGIDKDTVDGWRKLADYFIVMADRMKNMEQYEEKERQYNQDRVKAMRELDAALPMFLADETQQKLLAAEQRATNLKGIAARAAGGNEAEYASNASLIDAKLAQEQDAIRLEAINRWEIKSHSQTDDMRSQFNLQVELSKQWARNMEDGFTNLFYNPVGRKMRSLSEYLVDFVNSLQKAVAGYAAKELVNVGGSLLSSAWFGLTNPEAAQISVGESAAWGYPAGRASGGPVSAGQLYRVGEGNKGEYFIPGESGSVVPGGAAPKITVVVQNQGPALDAEQGDTKFDSGAYIVNVITRKARSSPTFRNILAGGGA